jgi:hypothetical protein
MYPKYPQIFIKWIVKNNNRIFVIVYGINKSILLKIRDFWGKNVSILGNIWIHFFPKIFVHFLKIEKVTITKFFFIFSNESIMV